MKRKKPLTVVPNDPMPETKVVSMTPRRKISDSVLARSAAKPPQRENAFQLPSFPRISIPRLKEDRLAYDQQIIEVNAWAVQNTYNGAFTNGATFLGYPYLAELAQIPEYRKITETVAMHMTRKFITLKATGVDAEAGDSKAEKIKQITDDIENFKVRDVFRKAAEVDGYFGRAHLYVDLGYQTPQELKFPIGNGRDALSQLKVKPGMLQGFKIIEPVWTYPSSYNSNNPLTGDWYNPQSWFVLGKELHHTRLIRMVGREVPDLLKPSYAFGGLALSQMAKPYVDNWLRTRQSVADVVWSFSTSGVMTDMQTLMQSQGDDLFARAELYNNLRNNRGLMILNKDSEEFFQINTPLGTLDKLQAQAQEHMASVSSIPLVFLLGITPSGLNASSEGEIRVFYDFIHAFQTKFFTEPLTRVIDFIQLNRFGTIDPEITFEFEPLWSMDEKSIAEIDKTKAETDDMRINGGVISPLEARKAVANAPDSPYPGLDVTVIPVPPGGEEPGEDPEDPEGGNPIGGRGLNPGKPEDHPRIGGDDNPFANDAGFEEGKHPRGQPGNAGQFGKGGSGSSKPKVVEHYGSYAVEHNGEHVKNKLGNRKLFNTPEAAQKFADTYTGEESGSKKKPTPSKSTLSKGDKFKTVTTVQEYLDIAKKSERNLSPEDKEAISHYTSPEYAALNQSLREGKELSPETKKIVDNLDRIIGESKLSEPVSLFRGVKGKKLREQFEAMLPGDVISDPGFVSTSMANHVARGQTQGANQKATMIIRAPAGANAAFPGEHSYNAVPGEGGTKVDNAMEAILPRGSQFKMIGKHGATYEFELVQSERQPDKGSEGAPIGDEVVDGDPFLDDLGDDDDDDEDAGSSSDDDDSEDDDAE